MFQNLGKSIYAIIILIIVAAGILFMRSCRAPEVARMLPAAATSAALTAENATNTLSTTRAIASKLVGGMPELWLA